MAKLMIEDGGCQAVTVLCNVFIDEYMTDANDAQLKTYLCLLRMLQSHCAVSVCDLADTLNHTEREIMRSLRYWEKQGVMELTFGEGKLLTGIRLLPLKRQNAQTAESSLPVIPASEDPVLAPVSVSAQTVSSQTVPDPAHTAARQSLLADSVASYSKPAYSLDDLKQFKERSNTSQLLFVAEQYLGRTLSAADMRSILFFTDSLEFSDDLIDYLLQYCVERGKKDFRYIEKVAIAWKEQGITTPQEAIDQAAVYDKTVYSVMKALGKSSNPTQTEINYINRWTKEYGFELDVILEACARTVLATDRHRFSYADKILNAWHDAGIKTLKDVPPQGTYYQEKTSSRQQRTSAYNQFMQNDYDFNALEQQLLRK